MGYEYDRRARKSAGKARAYCGIGIAVHGGERIIEDYVRSGAQKSTRNGDPLLLTARKRYAAFAHNRIVTRRKGAYVFVHAGRLCGLNYALLPHVFRRGGYIFRNCARVQIPFLQHKAHVAAHSCGRYVLYIFSAYGYATFVGGIKSVQKVHQRGLAAARAAYYAERAALRNGETYVFEHGFALFVAEAYIFEFYVARKRASRAVVLFLGVHNFAYARNGYARAAHIGNYSAELAHGAHKHCVIGYERHQIAGTYAAVKAEQRAYYNEQHALQRGKKVVGSPVHGKVFFNMYPKPRIVHVLLFKLVALIALPAERAHHAHARKIFLRERGEYALLLVTLFEGLARLGVKDQRICQKHGYERRRYGRKFYVHHKHKRERKHYEYDNAHERGELVGYEVGDGVRIRGAALNYVARLMGGMPPQRQSLYMRKQFVAHTAHKRLVGAVVEVGDAILEHRHNEGKPRNHQRKHPYPLLQPLRAAKQCRKPCKQTLGRDVVYYAVYGKTYDLGDDDVDERYHQAGKNAYRKQQAAAP